MNAPLENRNRVAGVEECGGRSPHDGVTTQSKDELLARLERLLALREDSCESLVEPQRPLPVGAREEGDGPWDRASRDKLEAFLRTDFAAIETEVGVKNARPHTPRVASWKAATSNALPDSTDELTASRHKARTVASDPVVVVDRRDALPRIYITAAVVIVGLAALGAGIAFWTDHSHLAGASEAETELAEPSSQLATRVDVPAHFAAMADPGASASAFSDKQTGDAPQPQSETQSAIAPRGDSGTANQTASAPVPPTPTFMQAEPVGITASPEPKKAETLLTAPLIGAIPPPEAPSDAAKLLSLQSPAAVVSPPTPKKTARTPKTAKPSVAAKLNNRSPIKQTPKTIAPETVAKPNSSQPPNAETEASAPKPAASPESDGPSASLKSAPEAVNSFHEAVKNWVGMDAASQP